MKTSVMRKAVVAALLFALPVSMAWAAERKKIDKDPAKLEECRKDLMKTYAEVSKAHRETKPMKAHEKAYKEMRKRLDGYKGRIAGSKPGKPGITTLQSCQGLDRQIEAEKPKLAAMKKPPQPTAEEKRQAQMRDKCRTEVQAGVKSVGATYQGASGVKRNRVDAIAWESHGKSLEKISFQSMQPDLTLAQCDGLKSQLAATTSSVNSMAGRKEGDLLKKAQDAAAKAVPPLRIDIK